MAESETLLHMVQMKFSLRDLHRSAREQKLPPVGGRGLSGGSVFSSDLGYLMHGQLQALFGSLAPKPFHLKIHRDTLDVFGYCEADGAALRDHMETFAEPRYRQQCLELACKAMPAAWADGRRLGFEVRVCPVVRRNSAGEQSKGSEVDAYQAAAQPYGDEEVPFRREDTYRDWLAQRLDGVAALESFKVERFHIRRLYRQTQGKPRRGKLLQRPAAEFHGELTLTDGDAFGRLLARGIGRHRAFGFGMLLLRPPGRI